MTSIKVLEDKAQDPPLSPVQSLWFMTLLEATVCKWQQQQCQILQNV